MPTNPTLGVSTLVQVGNEDDLYRLTIYGEAGLPIDSLDSLSGDSGAPFSTKDAQHSRYDCSRYFGFGLVHEFASSKSFMLQPWSMMMVMVMR